MNIDLKRLQKNIEDLARIGRDPRGGVTRPSFSQADFEARAWLKDRICEAGLCYRQDGAGNIFGRLGGDGRAVLVGSHLDTVINGGAFDGAVGVLAALECLRRIKEQGFEPARPLELVSFTDEEGNLVGDFLGSRAFAGLLNKEEVEKGLTSFGRPLKAILEGTEFSLESILEAHKQRPELEAYLELHIEQGATLEMEDVPIGIVERLAGKIYRQCSFVGQAAHGGTTPLELRHDAFLATADFALRGTQLVATKHYGSMITVGKVTVHPGSFSVVPGKVDFTLDVRSSAGETLQALDRELLELAEDIASTRGASFYSRIIDRIEPVSLSERIIGIMKKECGELGYSWMPITSGAGHDAQIVAPLAEAGMIFIPCRDGISHSPDEIIDWEDLEKGANLLLRTLLRLAG
ncbi:MAG TPA: M20 family metallo-hydrolase [Candidatus Desulfaltia sp.]|nr:M20 family metallo-hydrolase [Candidatus Desulfaltia sp.]